MSIIILIYIFNCICYQQQYRMFVKETYQLGLLTISHLKTLLIIITIKRIQIYRNSLKIVSVLKFYACLTQYFQMTTSAVIQNVEFQFI